MKNIRVLDCTLRDGGRIIDCAFQDEEIFGIADGLQKAGVDIIELGFLRDKIAYDGNSTFFTHPNQMVPFINKNSNAMYVAFADFGMFDVDDLPECDGTSITGLRVGFVKSQAQEVVPVLKKVKEKGYKLFIQGVNSLNYSDKEMLELVEMANEVKPYGFGIVDTYGAMYEDDVTRIFHLVNNNLLPEIAIDFHSHNNYQLSFALAQQIIRLNNNKRNIIIDSSLNGMGKCAGNLNTELITDYLNRKLNYGYDWDLILDIIDGYIYSYKHSNEWGYSIPALMAGVFKSHPNNIIYLSKKLQMGTRDIKNIMALIDATKRQSYDYDNIERIYIDYFNHKVDDSPVLEWLRNDINQRKVLVLSPGGTLATHADVIDEFIRKENPIVITVNFESTRYSDSFAFFGNQNRYDRRKGYVEDKKTIITSNVVPKNNEINLVDYSSLIIKGFHFFENSVMMLLQLLLKVGVRNIAIAGFDGFSMSSTSNYCDKTFNNMRNIQEADKVNEEISKMVKMYMEQNKENVSVHFLTPSKYLEEE